VLRANKSVSCAENRFLRANESVVRAGNHFLRERKTVVRAQKDFSRAKKSVCIEQNHFSKARKSGAHKNEGISRGRHEGILWMRVIGSHSDARPFAAPPPPLHNIRDDTAKAVAPHLDRPTPRSPRTQS